MMGVGDHYLQEMEEVQFDPKEFVERLSWKIRPGPASETAKQQDLDPLALQDAFEQAIKDLTTLYETTIVRTKKTELQCKEEEKQLRQKIQTLQLKNKASLSNFQELDERINFVATKVVHLGDQLESINAPRTRAVEAQKLINYFSEFLNPGPLMSEVFTDPSQLYAAADVIQKLNMIAQELPRKEFTYAKERIEAKYNEIETLLIGKFTLAHRADNRQEMKEIALILSHFKHYSNCINAFIDHSEGVMKYWKDIFPNVLPLCKKNYIIMEEVFVNPNHVMLIFIRHIYEKKLKEHIQKKLEAPSIPSENYLKNLDELYCKTVKLSNELSEFNFGNDPTLLHKDAKNIFEGYLQRYIKDETDCLKDKIETILRKFYEGLNHQKRPIQSGTLYGLKRTFQIGTSGPTENDGNQLLLTGIISMCLIQEAKTALRRSQMLSSPIDLAPNAVNIFDILLYYFNDEYIDYALEIGLQNIPVGEMKEPPTILFFDIVRECTTSMQLFDKMFIMSLTPLTINSPKHAEIVQKKKNFTYRMEQKIDTGIERSLSAIVSWISYVLKTEQKKTDFKPELKKQGDDKTDESEKNDAFAQSALIYRASTEVCMKIVKYLNTLVEKINECFDGKNVDGIFSELGIRFHRLVFEHIQQIQFSEQGAVLLICDVNEYRKCVHKFNVAFVDELWESLFALCNLFVVPASSLESVCKDNLLAKKLDKTVVRSFIQLRPDQKSRLLNMKLN